MKRMILLLAACLTVILSAPAQSLFSLDEKRATPQREVRAVWLTTLKGLDWPKKPANTPEETHQQKVELCKILDRLKDAGINTVMFQSRIRSTTAYPSAIEPWDGIFTGKPGKAPLYDPLQFALEECHKRGMELHAWVVAFPICKTDVAKKLGKAALPYKHPKLCQRCGEHWMMDPGVPGTDDYIASICEEIVKKYQVDGIHLDYVRYPERGIPFNDNRTYRTYGKGKNKNEWRRENVTRVVAKIHLAVKSVRPWVKISCSPIGKHADLTQQSSYGWNAREAVHQDAQAWLKNGLMDMLFPMMYFDGKHFYPFAVDWQDNRYERQIVPGLGIYFLHSRQKNWDLDIIRRQMYFTREISAAGQCMFRTLFLLENVKGLYDFIQKDFYQKYVATPAMTWEDSIAPESPKVAVAVNHHHLDFTWNEVKDNRADVPVTYNLYYCPTDSFDLATAENIAHGIKGNHYTHLPVLPTRRRAHYAVTAVDAFGNESGAHPVCASTSAPARTSMQRVSRNGEIQVPEVDGAKYLLVSDLSGRHIFTTAYAKAIKVGQLAPGCYEIRTLGKKGKSHHLFKFWKE